MQLDIRCSDCGRKFDQKGSRGRRPKRCIECRERVKDKWRATKGTDSTGSR